MSSIPLVDFDLIRKQCKRVTDVILLQPQARMLTNSSQRCATSLRQGTYFDFEIWKFLFFVCLESSL